MLREDKEVLKTCAILVLLGFLISALFMLELEESRIKRLTTNNDALARELVFGQGGLPDDKQVQDNSQ